MRARVRLRVRARVQQRVRARVRARQGKGEGVPVHGSSCNASASTMGPLAIYRIMRSNLQRDRLGQGTEEGTGLGLGIRVAPVLA